MSIVLADDKGEDQPVRRVAMQRVLMCFDQEEADLIAALGLEVREIEDAGYEVKVATTEKGVEFIEQYAPHLLILFIVLGPDSPAWGIARHLRREKGLLRSLPIFVVVRGLPNRPFYYAEPEFQELYDEYYGGGGFLPYIERLLAIRNNPNVL
jgi:hypothetical protein